MQPLAAAGAVDVEVLSSTLSPTVDHRELV